jgi:predicted TPR repeat methyltransferase
MKQPNVRNYFDAASKIYDQQTNTPEQWFTPIKLQQVLISDPNHYTSALVIGAGTGRDIPAIYEHGVRRVSAIDISDKMLQIAMDLFPSVHGIHGDFLHLNSLNNKYDLISCMGVLEFVGNLNAFFSKCATLQERNGTIYLTYEPLIQNYEPQGQASEILGLGRAQDDYNQGVQVYRYSIQDFIIAANAHQYEIFLHEAYLAYTDLTACFQHFVGLRKAID